MHADGLLLLLLCLRWSDLAGRQSALSLLRSFASQPDSLTNILIGQLVVDTVGGQDDEIMLLRDLE